ncbi:serine/threonine-protein kinase [Streptomyces sp. TLI_146]|uniref:serine/threonine-protein kinase n=1 Tax=Streptomyces sp. TLI_146 TaxID=1938858 RepID=UPI000C6FD1A8|nr:serine/threonine-protein kinase [Streptomyces sp. TLI_146]PKV83305.1 protein kinase-like protein [Streptomyces sp. TLI_146]
MVHRGADPADSGEAELLPVGHRIGSWVVGEPIGAGGWATVYAGRPDHDEPNDLDEHDVALKVMPTAGLAPRQARNVAEAARRELELGRGAGHPRLVRLLDSLVLSAPDRPLLDGAIVLVMERARCSLRELLAAPVTEAEAARLVTGICEGLDHMHRSGWVHADLKPENILIGQDGEVRLSDFGFAIELTGTHGWTAPMGTLDYLPPERWREPLGERGVRIRPSADIWALGIIIHEVYAQGAYPFPGATPTARGAAVQEYSEGRAALRMDGAVPEFWRALAAECLAPTHTARAPHTAESLLERIRAHTAEGGTGRSRRRLPRVRRRPLFAALLAVLGCAAAGVALWAYAGGGNDQETGRIRVFNAERGCQDRADREPQCSLGLAIDPRRPYTADNVVGTRVWHGDILDAECQLPQGQPIIDEEDLRSTVWFRVRVPRDGAAATRPDKAWLPAVRTKDRPSLPHCSAR